MSDAPTPYDEVAYPGMICTIAHPDRLATTARLHGMSPPQIETARVLELGGGDGLNVIALATAYPDARFLSIDLAASAVARGQAMIAQVGVTNVRIEQGDIVALAESMDERFDYVIAHGVYAWVPPIVRPALMALVGRVLAPQGVAFIDYNAMPGGHIRQTLREMMLYATAGITDGAERDKVAYETLVAYGRPREGERIAVQALREHAKLVARKLPAVLHHDELGDWFAPQMLSDVAEEAEAAGLLFLNEADPLLQEDGFAPADAPEADTAAIVRIAQLRDYESMKFFRQSLFVRAEVQPARRPAIAAIAGLYASAPCERRSADIFAFDGGTISISDTGFADALGKLVDAAPARLPVTDLFREDEWLSTLHELAGLRFVTLHGVPREGAATVGERPLASPLARSQAAADTDLLVTLDHFMLPMRDPGPRTFLALLDGTRDRPALEAEWTRLELGDQSSVDEALRSFANAGLMIR